MLVPRATASVVALASNDETAAMGNVGDESRDATAGNGVLSGVRVLDVSIWRPGPYATQLLAELGAEVIKVEPPGGDPMRVYAGLFAALHADKRSVTLDLKQPTDREQAIALACDADVVVEGYRPGVAERLGVGYEQVRAVNPGVIYCSISGLGQDGPLADVPGHDLDYAAWAGVLAPEGGPPVAPAVPVADLAGGMAAALAVCAALVHRDRTGMGERIDVAMAGVLATWTGGASPQATGTGPATRGVPGYGTFATADGRYVALGVLTEDHFWRALCDTLALPDLSDLGFVARSDRLDELQARLAGAIATRTRDELIGLLLEAGVPAAPVLNRDEMLALEHFRAIDAVTTDPWATVPAAGFPFRLSQAPARRVRAAPELDEHAGATWMPRPQDASGNT
jgi:crotonobetainyl-CoA:carnitine CoA-transferase CaiB-like acyl-CoA transferase